MKKVEVKVIKHKSPNEEVQYLAKLLEITDVEKDTARFYSILTRLVEIYEAIK